MWCSLSTQRRLTRSDRMRAYPVSTYSTTPTVFRGARGRCLAVALDGMVFHEPVYVGDEVGRYAAILRVGKTSMTVRMCLLFEEQVPIAQALFIASLALMSVSLLLSLGEIWISVDALNVHLRGIAEGKGSGI
jgi:hypothetical protein